MLPCARKCLPKRRESTTVPQGTDNGASSGPFEFSQERSAQERPGIGAAGFTRDFWRPRRRGWDYKLPSTMCTSEGILGRGHDTSEEELIWTICKVAHAPCTQYKTGDSRLQHYQGIICHESPDSARQNVEPACGLECNYSFERSCRHSLVCLVFSASQEHPIRKRTDGNIISQGSRRVLWRANLS